MTHQLYATCPDPLKNLLAEEIDALGGTNIETGFRVVYFTAAKEVEYRAHLCLRMASRIRRILKDIPAHSPPIIFSKAKKIRFDRLFPAELPISIHIISANDGGHIPNHLIGSKIREAVNDSFVHHQGKVPNQSSRNAPIGIYGFYHNSRLMISVDTTHESLHKRNYRMEGHPAPLKETLAAALLRFCGYDGTQPFYDPMCGSGTIAIEAAQIAAKRAPQLYRKQGGFGFEYLNDFDSALWQAILKDARLKQQKPIATVYASDIDSQFVKMVNTSEIKAGLARGSIETRVQDFFKSEKPADTGLLIANIPYGLRLDEQMVNKTYLRAIGDHLKNHYQGWQCGILLPKASPYREIGLRPDKRAEFLNGKLPVKFMVFNIY